jgi:hypothetical protein
LKATTHTVEKVILHGHTNKYGEKSERKVSNFVPVKVDFVPVKVMAQHSVTLVYISKLFPLPVDKLFHYSRQGMLAQHQLSNDDYGE